ncbi:hypothetical protein EBB79_02995 [Parasedimentitalea marina]|uniref:Uncharacterized protein n=1 Tax=Parasedimentitalea marina TaxID=2483033 RepID=A0A3T0MYW7_9RHOB|nr:hypothetical protein EBB79_02995 [Parasedimentitalea marina]
MNGQKRISLKLNLAPLTGCFPNVLPLCIMAVLARLPQVYLPVVQQLFAQHKVINLFTGHLQKREGLAGILGWSVLKL